MLIRILFPSRVARVFLAGSCVYFLSLRYVVELMLICVLSLCCGGVAADVRYDFALLPLYGVRLVTYILIYTGLWAVSAAPCAYRMLDREKASERTCSAAPTRNFHVMTW